MHFPLVAQHKQDRHFTSQTEGGDKTTYTLPINPTTNKRRVKSQHQLRETRHYPAVFYDFKMTKLQLLNAYLTERLTVVVREILDVVGDTVAEYREETARTKRENESAKRENESLRRQLRDILLLAETDWRKNILSDLLDYANLMIMQK